MWSYGRCCAARVPTGEIKAFNLAKGFGNRLNMYSVSVIGLIPTSLIKFVRAVGNAVLADTGRMFFDIDSMVCAKTMAGGDCSYRFWRQ